MIIKVRRPQGAWKLFDDANDPVYLDKPVPYKQIQYILDDPTIECSVIIDRKSTEENPLDMLVQIVEFKQGDARVAVVFNTICYICNQEGKTIEKVAL